MTVSLTRTLELGDVGADVEAVRRACIRYLDDDAAWAKYETQTSVERRSYGLRLEALVKRVQTAAGLDVDGVAGPILDRTLRQAGAYDATADQLLADYASAHRALVYPNPAGPGVHVGQGIHQTGGLPGNWAIDFMAPGGTPVLASCDANVTRLRGRDPSTGTHPPGDVFGWSLYLEDAKGRTYYLTHLGTRTVAVGQAVRAGQQIGAVGRWPRDPARSHLHLGVTSPLGSREAKERIIAISKAPKLPAL